MNVRRGERGRQWMRGHSSSHKKPVPDCAPHLASGEAKATSFDSSNPPQFPQNAVPYLALRSQTIMRCGVHNCGLSYSHTSLIDSTTQSPSHSKKSKTKFSFHNPRALSFFMICLSSFFIRWLQFIRKLSCEKQLWLHVDPIIAFRYRLLVLDAREHLMAYTPAAGDSLHLGKAIYCSWQNG